MENLGQNSHADRPFPAPSFRAGVRVGDTGGSVGTGGGHVLRRSCEEAHPFPSKTAGRCRVCKLFVTRPDYRRLWGGEGPPPPARRPLLCVNLGDVIEPCASGDASRHVHECDVFHKCTPDPCGKTPAACSTCEPPHYVPDPTLLPKGFDVHTSGEGIGDAVVAYYAACGLASVTGRPVTFHSHHMPEWFAACSHPGVSVVPFMAGAEVGVDCNSDYPGQMRAAAAGTVSSRAQWLCDNLSSGLGVPRFAPLVPEEFRRPTAVLPAGYVLLAPFSLTEGRQWPVGKYAELANEIAASGRRVVVIGTTASEDALRAVFGTACGAVSFFWGQHPAWVTAAVAHADAVVGNDSGMAHVAGLMRVPTRAIMTHLRAEFVFPPAEVQGVTGEDRWACQGCAWEASHGFRSECKIGCAALLELGTGRVMAAVPPPRVAVPLTPAEVLATVADKLGRRAGTIRWVLEQMRDRFRGPVVIETGCVRSPLDWSAGYFTWIAGAWLTALGRGQLVSVDNDAGHCRTARTLCAALGRVSVVEMDSVAYLRAAQRADVVYLDSLDTYMPGTAEHGLAEAEAAERLLGPGGLIAFDDTPPVPGGWDGKGRLAVPWLLGRGWRVVPASDYVTVLERVR